VNGLLARALLAFLALPGVVAFLVPVWVLPRRAGALTAAGLGVVAAGTLVLLRCVRDFYVAGKGTLAPWAPPQHLVTAGLYQYSRNPMYVGVSIILVGWAVAYQSGVHVAYTALVMFAFYVRVVFFEEPWLARTYGERWQAYRTRVRRRFV
jgi:protein-S-isoprenylcysteine O-methyltransferase Ste14